MHSTRIVIDGRLTRFLSACEWCIYWQFNFYTWLQLHFDGCSCVDGMFHGSFRATTACRWCMLVVPLGCVVCVCACTYVCVCVWENVRACATGSMNMRGQCVLYALLILGYFLLVVPCLYVLLKCDSCSSWLIHCPWRIKNNITVYMSWTSVLQVKLLVWHLWLNSA